jgi:hypothetical protein
MTSMTDKVPPVDVVLIVWLALVFFCTCCGAKKYVKRNHYWFGVRAASGILNTDFFLK